MFMGRTIQPITTKALQNIEEIILCDSRYRKAPCSKISVHSVS